MLRELKARPLLEGYRGQPAVDLDALIEGIIRFSSFAAALEGIFDSIDINPLMCSSDSCTAADARILLQSGE
jgi:hypothetical protein